MSSKCSDACHHKNPKNDHITPVLKSLHWLLIAQRIKFKLGLVYKTLLHANLTYPTYSYNTHAAGTGKLHVPLMRPLFQNFLDEDLWIFYSLASFRSRLKHTFPCRHTHLTLCRDLADWLLDWPGLMRMIVGVPLDATMCARYQCNKSSSTYFLTSLSCLPFCS
jgi:hypothetical protein